MATVERLKAEEDTSDSADSRAVLAAMQAMGYTPQEVLEAVTDERVRVELVQRSTQPREAVEVVQPNTQSRAARTLNLLRLLVPKRIADEEIGDALETIHSLRTTSTSPWIRVLVWLKVATTCFWVVLHALREVGKTVSDKKTQ